MKFHYHLRNSRKKLQLPSYKIISKVSSEGIKN